MSAISSNNDYIQDPVKKPAVPSSKRKTYCLLSMLALGIITCTLIFVFDLIQSSVYLPGYFEQTVFTETDREFESTSSFHFIEPLQDAPDLVIIGSTNGGTTTINQLLNDLHGFYTYPNKQLLDFRYWSPCLMDQHGELRPRRKRRLLSCDMNAYLHTLGIHPHLNDSVHVYHWERSSDYNRFPEAMHILSVKFPSTKFLLTVRESLTQTLSRSKNFQCSQRNNRYHTKCVNKVFRLRMSESLENGHLLQLLSSPQTPSVRQEIIDLFIRREIFEHGSMDICPYINILVMLDYLDRYNHRFGHSRFKVVQFESMVSDLDEAVRNMYCFVVSDPESFEQCRRVFVLDAQNLDNYEQWNNSSKGKKARYQWLLSDEMAFDALNRFHEVCDQRLHELLQQYDHSLVLGSFDFQKWTDLRSMVRDSVLQNAKQT